MNFSKQPQNHLSMSSRTKSGTLFLVPNTLGEYNADKVIPEGVLEVSRNLKHFIAENEKTARRYLKSIGTVHPLNDLEFFTLNKHTDSTELDSFLKPLLNGIDMGLISEAGLPAIADPGAQIVSRCHRKGIRVTPLNGPSSIILALIASGFNGQSFTFHGYLPIDRSERQKALKRIESAARSNQTQIFMETPFRNEKLLDQLIQSLQPDTLLCIARDITLDSERITTKPLKLWKKQRPSLHKRPCIFAIGIAQ